MQLLYFFLGMTSMVSSKNKEINNGRLAMIGAAGIMVQEWISGVGVFN